MKENKNNVESKKQSVDNDLIIIPRDLKTINRLLIEIENSLQSVKHLLFVQDLKKHAQELNSYSEKEKKVVEGVFDGEEMIGRDGKKYPVPPNYASKSKLVSGDILKLSITTDGTFIFKQIGPIERRKAIGILEEKDGHYFVNSEDRSYRVLLASVTYFKAQPGDKITVIIPKVSQSEWATIENVIESK